MPFRARTSPALAGLLLGATASCTTYPEPTGPRPVTPAPALGADRTDPTNEPPALDDAPYTDAERAQSGDKLGGVYQTCHEAFRPSDDPRADLGRFDTSCGRATGMPPLLPPATGDAQSAAGPSQRFQFTARAGRCYRVFAVGQPTVENLDVTLLDETGADLAGETKKARFAVVPPRGPLCVDRTRVVTAEVAIAQGSGAFLLQVFGDGA